MTIIEFQEKARLIAESVGYNWRSVSVYASVVGCCTMCSAAIEEMGLTIKTHDFSNPIAALENFEDVLQFNGKKYKQYESRFAKEEITI